METTAVSGRALSAPTPSRDTAPTSDFETFLKMMTTQLQNQDPLNPLDSADFAVQLATFSNVEQQVRTNELLENLTAQMGLNGMAELAGFVGMEARAIAPARFAGQPIEMSLDLETGADEGMLVITDENGVERQRLEIDAAASLHVWDGTDAGGAQMRWGSYSFTVESYREGELIGVAQAPVYSRVMEARIEGEKTVLLLEGGASVAADEVTALRFPVVYESGNGA